MFLNTDSQQAFEINQLLIGKLKINFILINLIDDNDKIEGNGFLYQNDSKELKIVFFRKSILQKYQEFELDVKKRHSRGGLKKPTCEVQALDNNGVSYFALCHFNPEFSQMLRNLQLKN